MKYLKPEEILNNPDYVQIIPNPLDYIYDKSKETTYYTRVSSDDDGWEAVLYYRFVGSITQDQPQNT
jgi:hypothetical protein